MSIDEKTLDAMIERHRRATDPAGKVGNWLTEVGACADDVPALVAEVRRLRAGLANIREIQGYIDGRVCTCSGVGCVQCIANATLTGREADLFS